MAPKTAEKKVASKTITKKASKKGGKKKGVESWKIYIYKVRDTAQPVRPCDPACSNSLLPPAGPAPLLSSIVVSRRS